MSGHTKEPWYFENGYDHMVIFAAVDGIKVEVLHEPHRIGPHSEETGAWVDAFGTKENLLRAIACVNACAGISTDQLEAGILKDMVAYLEGKTK